LRSFNDESRFTVHTAAARRLHCLHDVCVVQLVSPTTLFFVSFLPACSVAGGGGDGNAMMDRLFRAAAGTVRRRSEAPSGRRCLCREAVRVNLSHRQNRGHQQQSKEYESFWRTETPHHLTAKPGRARWLGASVPSGFDRTGSDGYAAASAAR
jgi:hypothetical protein